MERYWQRTDLLHFDKGVFFLFALVLLSLPLTWILGWLLAVTFHEACHLVMIRILRGEVLRINIGIGGMKIEMAPMPPGKELLCAIAGPLGSLLLLCFFRIFPSMSVCAGIQGFFNLLPVYPLDGGRVLRCLLASTADRGERIRIWVETASLCAVLAVGFFLQLGFYTLMLGAILIIKKISLQSAAKRGTIVLHHEVAHKK